MPFAIQSKSLGVRGIESCIYDNVTKFINTTFRRDLIHILLQSQELCLVVNLLGFTIDVNIDCDPYRSYNTQTQMCELKSAGTDSTRERVTTTPTPISEPVTLVKPLSYMRVLSLELAVHFTTSELITDLFKCNDEFTDVILNYSSRQNGVINVQPDFIKECRDMNIFIKLGNTISAKINHTQFIARITVSFHATSEDVQNLSYNTCLARVLADWQGSPSKLLGRETLDSQTCGSLTVNGLSPQNVALKCSPGLEYQQQHNRCLDGRKFFFVNSDMCIL